MRTARLLPLVGLVVVALLLVGACSSSKKTATVTSGQGSSKSSSGSVSAFCSKYKKYNHELATDTVSSTSLKDLQDLASSAPADIKSDVTTLINAVRAALEIKANSGNTSKQRSLASGLDTNQLTSAGNQVDSYAGKNCKITFSS